MHFTWRVQCLEGSCYGWVDLNERESGRNDFRDIPGQDHIGSYVIPQVLICKDLNFILSMMGGSCSVCELGNGMI